MTNVQPVNDRFVAAGVVGLLPVEYDSLLLGMNLYYSPTLAKSSSQSTSVS